MPDSTSGRQPSKNGGREHRLARWASSAALISFPSLAVFILGAWAITTDGWHVVGIDHAFGATFADLRYLLATAECFRADPNWSLLSETCDPFDRPNNYPSPWVWTFAAAGASMSSVLTIAWGYLFLFCLSLSLLTWGTVRGRQHRLRGSALVATAACAPPTWFALERGSNEVVVFSLATVAWGLYVQHASRTSAALIGVISILKFFPAGAMLVFGRERSKLQTSVVVFAVVSALGLIVVAPELNIIRQRTPQPTDAAFGASVLIREFGLPYGRVLGGAALLLVTSVYVWLALRFKNSATCRSVVTLSRGLKRDRTAWALVAFGGGPLIAAYLLGSNYDYRLIFTIPLIAGLARLLDAFLARIMLSAGLLALYASHPFPKEVQMIGDLVWLLLLPILLLFLMQPWIQLIRSYRIRNWLQFEDSDVAA